MSGGIIAQINEAAQAAQAAQDASAGRAPASQTRSTGERLSLAGPLRFMLFMGILAGSAFIGWTMGVVVMPFFIVGGLVAAVIAVRMVHVAAQWERGVVLRLGRFQGMRGPGLVLIFPVIDYLKIVDTRVLTIEIPRQRVITRDNIPISVNGVLYFKVDDVQLAITKVQDYEFGILNYAMAALRDVIGRLTLDEMLAERDQVQKEIEDAIEKQATQWGLKVDALRLQDIDMPEELKRMMSRQASAEREKRATITKAEGDKLAALNLSEAAATMLLSPGAMQLRTLQTIDSLGASPSNTVVLTVPTDMLEFLHNLAKKAAPKVVDGG